MSDPDAEPAPLPWRLLARPGGSTLLLSGVLILLVTVSPALLGAFRESAALVVVPWACAIWWRVAAGALAAWIGLAAAVYRSRASTGPACLLAGAIGAVVLVAFDVLLALSIAVGAAATEGQDPLAAVMGTLGAAPDIFGMVRQVPLFTGLLVLATAAPPVIVLLGAPRAGISRGLSTSATFLYVWLARTVGLTAASLGTGDVDAASFGFVIGAVEGLPFALGVMLILTEAKRLRAALAGGGPP